MTIVLEPIRPKKISEEIVSQVKQLISKGELKPGDRIPSERELATMLGVSRPSVREAIMVLEAMGFVESRQGGGTYVKALTEASIMNPLAKLVEKRDPELLRSLAEVRMGLESWSAYLAAQRATDSDIAEMRRLYKVMEKQAAKGGWSPDVDAEFHYAITSASHNSLQMHVLDSIHSLFHATIQVALMEFYQQEGHVQLLLTHHHDIMEAIAAHDPELARKKMMEHLALVEEKMAQLLGK
ncbi:MAG: FadR family transcriptional regulator [Deltaproteobacteria bacterium]|jgi:GntR family transcriptional repressor for pyruvate dehydrogenase complex|nr:FadR family transcriptional regulator [Deltaproteobacteria bacterium]MBW2512829.1 FadR family transcriptional regulator [Deltaproteobacteria bacterium]MDH4006501.1 FadR family transcriptional regulator [Desulfuromonadales bacterium]